MRIVGAQIYVLLAVLAPNLGEHLIRPDDILLVILAAGPIIRGLGQGKLRVPLVLFYGLLFMLMLPLISTGLNVITQSTQLSSATTTEIFRGIKYLLVLITFCSFDRSAVTPILRSLFLGTIIAVGVQFMQALDLFGINDWLVTNYGGDLFFSLAHQVYADAGGQRMGSTFINPNVFGNFLIVPFTIAIVFLVAPSPRYIMPFSRFAMGVIAACSAAGIVLTQSRTAIITACVVLGIIGGWGKRLLLISPRRFLGVLVAFGALVLTTALFFNSRRFYDIAAGFGTDGYDGSLTVKLSIGLHIITLVLGSNPIHILFGYGPEKNLQADFELGYMILWYGLTGIFVYATVLMGGVWITRMAERKSLLSLASLALVVGSAIYGVGATTLLNNRVYPLFLVVFALTFITHCPSRAQHQAGSL